MQRYDIITQACPNFNGGLPKPWFNLRHGWEITWSYNNVFIVYGIELLYKKSRILFIMFSQIIIRRC